MHLCEERISRLTDERGNFSNPNRCHRRRREKFELLHSLGCFRIPSFFHLLLLCSSSTFMLCAFDGYGFHSSWCSARLLRLSGDCCRTLQKGERLKNGGAERVKIFAGILVCEIVNDEDEDWSLKKNVEFCFIQVYISF